MKQDKKIIGVLDMNIDSIYILNALRNTFKNDDIYYINDLNIDTYEGLDVNDIKNYVSNNIEYLKTKNINVLVVVNDTIIEYCDEYLNELDIPVIKIVDESINYINENYEYKNFGFLACTSIIEANIYQKNFRYNHLYNINGDNLKDLIRTHLVKTTESFQEVKNVIASVYKKDLNIIIPSLVNFLMVKTEINEFLKDVDLLPIDTVLCDKVKNVIYKNQLVPEKGKGKTYICVKEDLDKKTFDRFVKTKYEILNIYNVK